MAGSEILYQVTFDDYNGVECQVQICQPGYSASVTEVTGGPVPALIRLLNEGDNKFVHIKAVEAVAELISTTSLQYLNLFISTNKSYFMRIYRGDDLLFTGWVNPEYYIEPFEPPPYVTAITATDGIAELKNIPFPITAYETFKRSFISYISTCLSQLGADITDGITIKVDDNFTCTTTADGAVTTRALEYLFIDYRAMRDEEDLWSCYDVLNEILSTLNARLFFYCGSWHIEKIDHKHEAYPVIVYDMTGAYVSTITRWDAVVPLTDHQGPDHDIRFVHSPATLEVQPAYKAFNITHEYGNRKNILKSSNFDGAFYADDFLTDTSLRYWSEAPGSEIALVRKVQLDDYKVLAMEAIPYAIGQVPSFTAYIEPIATGSPASEYVWTYNEGGSNEDELMAWMYGEGSMKLKYSVFGHTEIFSESEPKLKAFVRVYINCSGRIYNAWSGNGLVYDNTDYEWLPVADTSTDYDYRHFTTVCKRGEWVDELIDLRMPEDELGVAQTYVGVKILVSSPNLNEATMGAGYGIYYRELAVYFTTNLDDDFTENNDYPISGENILEPETYEVKFAESPAPYDSDGYGLVNRYVVFDSAGNAVNGFGNKANYNLRLVDQLLYTELFTTYRQPLFKLTGSIIDTTIGNYVTFSYPAIHVYPDNYIVITNHGFTPIGGTINLLFTEGTSSVPGLSTGEYVEFTITDAHTLTLTTGAIYTAGTGTGHKLAASGIDFRTILKDYTSRYYFPTGLEYNVKDAIFTGEWMMMYDESGSLGEFSDDFNEDFYI